jgi:tetratricopeptide (TPR) repeat protein
MTEGRLSNHEDKIIEILNAAYQDLKEGAFAAAIGLLEKALEIDLEHPGVASTLRCAGFWRERQEQEQSCTDTYDRGELLLSQWKAFAAFAERLGDVPEQCVLAVKQHVFSSALAHYLQLCEADSGDPEALLRVGRCYKGLGNYELAIVYLEKANRERRESAEQLAELADAYSLASETRTAKVFFREAFFLDPQGVDLAVLESPMIRRLEEKVRRLGFSGPEVNEWLPVYGTIYGVLNVKREMKPLELGKLKQSVFLMEKEIETKSEARGLVPRLINRYFWLIDHYLSAGEGREKIEEILARIRELDPRVYREYAT